MTENTENKATEEIVENTENTATAEVAKEEVEKVPEKNTKKVVVKLLTAKKKIETGKWSYRGFVIAKDASKWCASVLEGSKITDEQAENVIDEPLKSAKAVCILIDKTLGALTDAEINKTKKPRQSKEEKQRIKDEKSRAISKVKMVAYEIKNAISILGSLTLKEFNDRTTTAPNNVDTNIRNGYKIGWVSGTYYDIPEINEDIENIIKADNEIVETFKVKYEDFEIEYSVTELEISILVTYKKN